MPPGGEELGRSKAEGQSLVCGGWQNLALIQGVWRIFARANGLGIPTLKIRPCATSLMGRTLVNTEMPAIYQTTELDIGYLSNILPRAERKADQTLPFIIGKQNRPRYYRVYGDILPVSTGSECSTLIKTALLSHAVL